MPVEDFIRPSALQATEVCPGRAMMSSLAVAQVPAIGRLVHAVAMQGIMGHAVIAQTLELIYQRKAWTLPEDALTQMAGAIGRLEAWTRDAVRKCVAYGVALVDEASRVAGEIGGFVSILIEMKLSGQGINIARGGTADLIILIQTDNAVHSVVVCDWKLGHLDQGEAADHLQLGCYAVMAADKYKPTHGTTVHLAQGRRQEFTSASYQDKDIEGVRFRAAAAIKEAWADRPRLNPHIDACRYGPCLTHCGAVRQLLTALKDRQDLFGAGTVETFRTTMRAGDPGSLVGDEPIDRMKLAETAAMARKHLSAHPVARRFAEEARDLAKEWQRELQGVGA